MGKIKVVVVDDSALMRKMISDMLNGENDIEVIKTFKNGEELLNKIDDLDPDVITLDVEMPILDGKSALKELKRRKKDIPVIMLSSMTSEGSNETIECLRLGAFDFVSKTSGAISLDIGEVKESLVEKIKMASKKSEYVHIEREFKNYKINEKLVDNPITKSYYKCDFNKKISAVVIGASTGGPRALFNVITNLPKNIGVPIFIVQHMPETFTKVFSERLNCNSNLKVVEAENGMKVENNVVYIAKGGYHMEISLDKKIVLNKDNPIWGVRPAVDKLFISASKVYGDKLISVVLTGMGKDGAKGTEVIKNFGGVTISEDRSTCIIYGMPKAAFNTGKVDFVLTLDKIGSKLTELVKG